MEEITTKLDDPVVVFTPSSKADIDMVSSMLQSANIPFVVVEPGFYGSTPQLFVSRRNVDDVRALIASIEKSEETEEGLSADPDFYSEVGMDFDPALQPSPSAPLMQLSDYDADRVLSRMLWRRAIKITLVLIIGFVVVGFLIAWASNPSMITRLFSR